MSILRVSVFAVMAGMVSKRMPVTSLLERRDVHSGVAVVHLHKSRHEA